MSSSSEATVKDTVARAPDGGAAWIELCPPDYPEGNQCPCHCRVCGGKNRQDDGWRYRADPVQRAETAAFFAGMPASMLAMMSRGGRPFAAPQLTYECDRCRGDVEHPDYVLQDRKLAEEQQRKLAEEQADHQRTDEEEDEEEDAAAGAAATPIVAAAASAAADGGATGGGGGGRNVKRKQPADGHDDDDDNNDDDKGGERSNHSAAAAAVTVADVGIDESDGVNKDDDNK
jgi:hypothetical protein